MDGEGEAGDALDVALYADARSIPSARRAVCRWMLRRQLDEARSLVEFVASELLAEGVMHATDGLDLHVEEADVGVVRIEVQGLMVDAPTRFRTIAGETKRRREALLNALCRSHDRVRIGESVTLWAEVQADRRAF